MLHRVCLKLNSSQRAKKKKKHFSLSFTEGRKPLGSDSKSFIGGLASVPDQVTGNVSRNAKLWESTKVFWRVGWVPRQRPNTSGCISDSLHSWEPRCKNTANLTDVSWNSYFTTLMILIYCESFWSPWHLFLNMNKILECQGFVVWSHWKPSLETVEWLSRNTREVAAPGGWR